ncbi:hypothetical protein HanHA300_Chr09g0301361 [Helianthus annuus]|nr:hypothetical protein HanHA300_Chr09g0301361 [Helianthus annuus]
MKVELQNIKIHTHTWCVFGVAWITRRKGKTFHYHKSSNQREELKIINCMFINSNHLNILDIRYVEICILVIMNEMGFK